MAIDATVPGTPDWWLVRLGKQLEADRPRIDRLNAYHRGDPPLPWGNRRMRETFKELQRMARANFAGLIVEAVLERMTPVGFRTGAVGDDQTDSAAWLTWQRNSLDADLPLVLHLVELPRRSRPRSRLRRRRGAGRAAARHAVPDLRRAGGGAGGGLAAARGRGAGARIRLLAGRRYSIVVAGPIDWPEARVRRWLARLGELELELRRVRAEARTQEAAQGFLNAARDAGAALADELLVDLYPAVPMTIQRVANIERAQMLIECTSRKALQHFLAHWQADLHAMRSAHRQVIRWAVDVDPLAI